MKKLELVAPGGSLEKIEYAYHYGADAVYLGLPDFSLRSRLNDFTEKKMEKAIALARKLGKIIYFTLNIYAHERHLPKVKKHLEFIKKAKPDAVIISDPGIISLAKKIAPKINIHLSTQANMTNSAAVRFWEKQGISRIILAREVTLGEIKKIRKSCPKIELEYFVHGAMCMSYSGRCLLSRWMRNRSANLGDCVQPCRWPYHVTLPTGRQARNTKHITQDNGEGIILSEDQHGTYFLNSKDLCLIEHLDELAKAGINAFKIEGRTKSAYYVATAVRAYHQVLDAIRNKKSRKEMKKITKESRAELEKIVNRGYSTGFLFGKDKWENDFEKSHKKNEWQFVGEIINGEKNNRVRPVKFLAKPGASRSETSRLVKIHNALKAGDKVEIVTSSDVFPDVVGEIKNLDGKILNSAHGGTKSFYFIKFSQKYRPNSLIRKKV